MSGAKLAAVAGAVVAIALVAWWSRGHDVREGKASSPPVASTTASSRAVQAGTANGAGLAQLAGAAAAPSMENVDPLGGALDLKRVFDDHIGSANPRDRRIAARAFDACFPAFLPAGDQPPSPDPLIRSLPAQGHEEREAAYRDLFARCQGLLGMGRPVLEEVQRQLQVDIDSQETGARAQEDALAGRMDRIDTLVAQSTDPANPAAVAALGGIASRLAQRQTQDSRDPALVQRARAVDAALPLVACDLGLDCSAGSLTALQLCAVQGLCEGDVPARLSALTGADAQADVQQQRARLLALIRSGRKVSASDLLGQ